MARPITEEGHSCPWNPDTCRGYGLIPNQVWSWDISYLTTSFKGIWLYLYLVIDVWSRKVVAWDVEVREVPKLAADLASNSCLRERIGKRRLQPLILHAVNGNA